MSTLQSAEPAAVAGSRVLSSMTPSLRVVTGREAGRALRMARAALAIGVGEVVRIVRGWLRRPPPPPGVNSSPPDGGRRELQARARFWADLREGRREADARAARSRA